MMSSSCSFFCDNTCDKRWTCVILLWH